MPLSRKRILKRADQRIEIKLPGEPDGTCVLYLRKMRTSSSWYLKHRVPMASRTNRRNPYVVISLGTTDPELARLHAYEQIRRINGKVHTGQTVRDLTFRQIAKGWIEHLEADTSVILPSGRPKVKSTKLKRHRQVLDRYLLPYFGDIGISTIDHAACQGYARWRSRYYIDGPGSKEDEIAFTRNGKTMKRPARKSTQPTPSTLNKDAVAFSGVIKYARDVRHVRFSWTPRLKFDRQDREIDEGRRPRFTFDEWVTLHTGLRYRAAPELGHANCSSVVRLAGRRRQLSLTTENNLETLSALSETTRWYRMILSCLVDFIWWTGIRPNEVMWLQRRHIVRDEKFWNELRIVIDRSNPGLKSLSHTRVIIPRHGFDTEVIHRLFNFYGTHYNEKDWQYDSWENFPEHFWLWSKLDGSRIASADHAFVAALNNLGLRKTADGRNFTLYSLRHTYASEMIEGGAAKNGLSFLAANLGTSPTMIQKHYGQLFNASVAGELLNTL